MDKCAVAILGFGKIGSGTAELLRSNREKVTASSGRDVSLKYIVDVRFPEGSEFEQYFTQDFAAIESDPEVKVVVETIGGVTHAYDYTKRALLAGKSVQRRNYSGGGSVAQPPDQL